MNPRAPEGWADSFFEIVAELLFALLPLTVLLLNRVFSGDSLSEIMSSAELAFVSAVLLGQAIAKYVARAIRQGIAVPQAVLTVTVVIVLGLVPALLTLSWSLNAPEDRRFLLPFAEVPLFILSILVFVVLGSGVILRRKQASTRPPE